MGEIVDQGLSGEHAIRRAMVRDTFGNVFQIAHRLASDS
jgi:hypothetical protein